MSLPEYIVTLNVSTGIEEPHGIIYQIRSYVTNDNITNYVIVDTNGSAVYYKNNPIKWSDYWQGSDYNGYYQVEFKDRFVFPTHYSLRGRSGSYSYSKEWNLFGFNSEDEDFTLLSNDTCYGSTYCAGGIYIGCNSPDWGTFAIKNTPHKAFRYFRITHPSYNCFYISGIEFFGVFTTNLSVLIVKRESNCSNAIPLFFRLHTPLILVIITLLI